MCFPVLASVVLLAIRSTWIEKVDRIIKEFVYTKKVLHPGSDVERFYIPWQRMGKGDRMSGVRKITWVYEWTLGKDIKSNYC